MIDLYLVLTLCLYIIYIYQYIPEQQHYKVLSVTFFDILQYSVSGNKKVKKNCDKNKIKCMGF